MPKRNLMRRRWLLRKWLTSGCANQLLHHLERSSCTMTSQFSRVGAVSVSLVHDDVGYTSNAQHRPHVVLRMSVSVRLSTTDRSRSPKETPAQISPARVGP
ncbi:hypothetical protein CALVIDRAFT_539905 [Calocera viscosa TUFC12733]|uniref:Uncharacterized protein n=1 Tax=Calocera viscosa (strain TUFC12733) TaxID=1330018 RepID=A0A167JCN0_CALVF|nr:hypothetical protein CALVIDRAFT_539905 [Calocera viscosa TUFC12733]